MSDTQPHLATAEAANLGGGKFHLVDVGGAGGLQAKWMSVAERISPVLFEPNPAEASRLRDSLATHFDSALVMETGLSNIEGVADLHITRFWGCTSLRRPDPAVLSRYRIAPLFDVVDTATVSCTRYDSLYQAALVPQPDAIKIDVQGFEYEVLLGFGGLLQNCLGIELETHVYPIYQGQKLFGDLVDFLRDFGFVLRQTTPVPSFDGDVVELDAWFTKDISAWREFGPVRREKFRLLCEVWDLVDYSRIDPATHHNDLGAATTAAIGAPAAGSKPRYAILFKAHFWDAFVERQFRRLCARAGSGDVFVILDETNGPVAGVSHHRILSLTESTVEADGYLAYPPGKVFWHNTDYQLYQFFDRCPEYDYAVVCEYDCVVNIDVAVIIDHMVAAGLGFVGNPISTPMSVWHWAPSARPYYEADVDINGRLVCFAAFSRETAILLQAERRRQTRRATAMVAAGSDNIVWPNNEAFVGTEIVRLGVREAPLSKFGNDFAYDWAPPHAEAELQALSDAVVVHPVLDGVRYFRSIARFDWTAEGLFVSGSRLSSQMAAVDPEAVVALFLEHILDTRNWALLDKLRDYATARTGLRSDALFNVARGKPATQSSTCLWSRLTKVGEDAAGAVNGNRTGGFGFHTDDEIEPWWLLDLEAVCPVREIRVFNRMQQVGRARQIVVQYSIDLLHWTLLFHHGAGHDFGGIDGTPLTIILAAPIELRFIRIHLEGRQILHLDEVEVYI